MEYSFDEEKSFVDALLKISKPISLKKGQYIYHVDDNPIGLYYVHTGLVGLLRVSAKGQESLLRLFKKQQFFGHRSLFSNETYHGSARCMEDCEILFCPKSEVVSYFDHQPKGYYFLARALSKELRRSELRGVMISESEVIERVAAAILIFKNLYPDFKWTRTDIANFCASRTPTVIKTLANMEKQGLIKQVGRRIEILDEEKLSGLVNN